MEPNTFSLTSLVNSEDNPKAVFSGDISGIIQPLGLYLNKRNVELFAGKQLSDSAFGDYFFYVGTFAVVKDFLTEKKDKLPKTLLLLTSVSDEKEIVSVLSGLPVKTVLVQGKTSLTEEETQKIMDFFLGANEPLLDLRAPGFLLAPLPPDASFLKIVPQSTSQPILRTEILSESEKIISPDTETTVKTGLPQDDEYEKVLTIESFFRTQTKPTRVTQRPFLVAAFLTLFVLLVIPVVTLISGVVLGSYELRKTKLAIASDDISGSSQHLQMAQVSWKVASWSLSLVSPLLDVIHLKQMTSSLEGVIEVGSKTASGFKYVMKIQRDMEEVFAAVMQKNQGVAIAPLISKIKGNLTLADTDLALAQAEIKSPQFINLAGISGLQKFEDFFKGFTDQLEEGRLLLQAGNRGLSILPDLIGLYGERKYLIVLQNNMELRPTGGFIGSFGLLTFADGNFKNFEIHDIYMADGALKGHVDPPEPIRQYLGQEHWYMRDSNWDPDFPKSARQLIWFLEKELDVLVDGVVAIDLEAVRSLLEHSGPVTLSDYQETITSDNLFIKVQTETQTDFFPGSTQKKDVLSSLSRALVERLLSPDTDTLDWLTVLHKSLNEKHVQLFITKKNLEEILVQADWAGKLGRKSVCDETGCFADFVSIIDANLGANKVNYFVKRSLADEVNLQTDGQIKHTLTISYKNTSTKNSNLGGNYRNYFRVFTPSSAILDQVSVGGVHQTIQAGGIGSQTSVATNIMEDLSVFEGLIEVLPQTEKTVTLTYTLPVQTGAAPFFSYHYFHQKQAGTQSDDLTVTVFYPQNWQATEINHESSQVAGTTTLANHTSITYNSNLSEDYVLRTIFRRL